MNILKKALVGKNMGEYYLQRIDQ